MRNVERKIGSLFRRKRSGWRTCLRNRQSPGWRLAIVFDGAGAMNLSLTAAINTNSLAIAALRTSVAEHLTRRHGKGHWSSCVTEGSVLRDIKTSRVLAVWNDNSIVATLGLATKKPWAIDLKYFQSVPRALYLRNMAVATNLQGRGIGRYLMEEAKKAAKDWPSNAIRLDAYDAEAGAGDFYSKCGFREVGRVTYRSTPLVYYEFLLDLPAATLK